MRTRLLAFYRNNLTRDPLLRSEFSLEQWQEKVTLLLDDERDQPEAIDMKRDTQLARN